MQKGQSRGSAAPEDDDGDKPDDQQRDEHAEKNDCHYALTSFVASSTAISSECTIRMTMLMGTQR